MTAMSNRRLGLIALACGLTMLTSRAQAQVLRGVVTESQTGRPVAGAVVLLMDSAGSVLTRAVTSEQGAYSVRRPADAVRGQVLRLGFRPRVISVGELASAGAGADLPLVIIAIPQMLEPVTARAGATCPKRRDRQAAFGFWEQAK